MSHQTTLLPFKKIDIKHDESGLCYKSLFKITLTTDQASDPSNTRIQMERVTFLRCTNGSASL